MLQGVKPPSNGQFRLPVLGNLFQKFCVLTARPPQPFSWWRNLGTTDLRGDAAVLQLYKDVLSRRVKKDQCVVFLEIPF